MKPFELSEAFYKCTSTCTCMTATRTLVARLRFYTLSEEGSPNLRAIGP